MQMKDKTSY